MSSHTPPDVFLPDELQSIIHSATEVGALSGIAGLLVGGTTGLVRSSTPILFTVATGVQWFTLGGSFWAARASLLRIWGSDSVTSRDKVYASTIAGSIGGCAGGLLRGRRNVLPGAAMFAVFGATGQLVYNMVEHRRAVRTPSEGADRSNSWLNSRWSPVKVLSDEEYASMLQEKLLHIRAEIALVDDNLNSLKHPKDEQENSSSTSGAPPR